MLIIEPSISFMLPLNANDKHCAKKTGAAVTALPATFAALANVTMAWTLVKFISSMGGSVSRFERGSQKRFS